MPLRNITNSDSFTPKQIQIVRKLLRDFKLGNRLSWLQVTREIIASESNDFDFPKKEGIKKKDKGWFITERILRNFVDGEDYRGKGKKEKTKIRSHKKLCAIRDFLIEEDLLPSMFNEEGFLKFREAYYLSQYFSKGNNEGFIWEEIDLSGNYKIKEMMPSEDKPRTLKFDLFENERFYEIEERYYFKTHGGLKDIKHWGWAVNTPFDGLLIFLQGKDGNKINHHIYIGHSLKFKKYGNIELELKPNPEMKISGLKLKIAPLKRPKKKFSSENFCFIKELPDSFDKKSTKVKESKEIEKRGAALNLVSYFGGSEYSAMSDENIEGEFLYAVCKGDVPNMKTLIERGVDVNCRTTGSNSTALHIAAAEREKEVIRALAQCDKIDYLVRNNEGQFPSTVAMISGGSAVLSTFLTKKEIQQARREGKDYLSLVRRKDFETDNIPEPS